MAEEIESKEQAPKSNRILFCYFFIVLLLGLVAIGILVRACDTAFVEREAKSWRNAATVSLSATRTGIARRLMTSPLSKEITRDSKSVPVYRF